MLRIHILNVGQGDSIILEYADEKQSAYAVIDSNCKPGATPRALEVLKAKKVSQLSFVAITHPHADHYMGMREILSFYSNKIDAVYTFPVQQDPAALKKLILAYKKAAETTDDSGEQQKLVELGHILHLASKVAGSWEAPAGTISQIPASGFSNVKICTLLPPARVKGDFFNRIASQTLEPESKNLNDLSMAFLIEYMGHQIILAGDGTRTNWIYQANKWAACGQSIFPAAVKLPHHGSKHDCCESVQKILFGLPRNSDNHEAIACISANGKTHPSEEVLEKLVSQGIKPYCTNLARRCGAQNQQIIDQQGIDPAMLRFVRSAMIDSDDAAKPCQGDILIELTPNSPIKIATQFKHLCALRGDFDFLSGSLH